MLKELKITRLSRNRSYFDEDDLQCCLCGKEIKEKDNIDFLVFFEGDIADLFDYDVRFNSEDDGHTITCSSCSKINDLVEIGIKLRKRAEILQQEHKKYDFLATYAQKIKHTAKTVFNLIDEKHEKVIKC